MDDVKKGIAGAAKAITKGGGTLIKTTRISLSLTNEESKLNAIYNEIGKKVHEIYSYGGSLGEYFDAKYVEILARQNRINELKAARDVAKGIITCANCGKTANRGSDFCPKCGANISEAASAAEPAEHRTPEAVQPHIPESQVAPVQPDVQAAPATKQCGVCGSENAASDRFCLSCGRIL